MKKNYNKVTEKLTYFVAIGIFPLDLFRNYKKVDNIDIKDLYGVKQEKNQQEKVTSVRIEMGTSCVLVWCSPVWANLAFIASKSETFKILVGCVLLILATV